MLIDDPAVIAEARAVFDRYEQATATNDTTTLDASPQNSPRAVRIIRITALGPDVACTHLEYERLDTGLVGRETKIMARLPGLGWRVVSAHVSLLAAADPGRVANAAPPPAALDKP